MTPEGRVKKAITLYLDTLRASLRERGHELHWSMFVPSGYGRNNTLDYTICFAGRWVSIEAKAPGEDLTPLQKLAAKVIYESGGQVFIISGPEGLAAFKRWVERHADWYP